MRRKIKTVAGWLAAQDDRQLDLRCDPRPARCRTNRCLPSGTPAKYSKKIQIALCPDLSARLDACGAHDCAHRKASATTQADNGSRLCRIQPKEQCSEESLFVDFVLRITGNPGSRR